MNNGTIPGGISKNARLIGTVVSKGTLTGTLRIPSGSGGLPYDGPYDVIPSMSQQVLPTADRVLERNVKVEKIPYYEVGNDYGETFIIGGENDGTK